MQNAIGLGDGPEARRRCWWRRFLVVALIACPVVVAAQAWYGGWSKPPRFDEANPDYEYVTSLISAARAEGDEDGLIVLDLVRINRGEWQFLCVIGAESDPAAILSAEAGRRSIRLEGVDPIEPKSWAEVNPVGEHESAIAFVDDNGRGRTVLLDTGNGLPGPTGPFRCYDAGTKTAIVSIFEY